MPQDEIPDSTRRAVLKSIGASVAVGAAGSAAAHPGGDSKSSNVDGEPGERFRLDEGEPFANAEEYGYHSMGGTGPSGVAGQAEQRKDGDTTSEVRCHGDIAVATYRQSNDEDAGRRMATLDISEFNDASTEAELEEAELTVLGILRNFSAEANLATDVKLSDDGNYAFLGTQDLTPYNGGGDGEPNETDPRGNAESSGGVVAVDITDPGRPRTVDRIDEAFSTGVHNVYYHRIGGTDYVFACKDAGLIAPDSALNVIRFDRDPGKLTIVNRWTADGNTARGEVGTEHKLSYVHDVEVQDDPRTGRPTVYLSDWDRGMRILDASDPTNMQHIGQFDMYQTHFATPFPELVEDANGDERRVAIASHEEPDERFDQRSSAIYNTPHEDKTNPNSTGTVYLIDCEGIYPEDPDLGGGSSCGCSSGGRSEGDGPKQLGELDNWTWKNVDTGKGFEDTLSRKERFEAIGQDTFSFRLSPHNSQGAVHQIGGEERYIIHQGHYHGGIRYLEIEPGSERGLTGDARRKYRPKTNPNVDGRDGSETIGWINNTTDWNLAEVGHGRPFREGVGLSPDFWCSVEHNGLSFHGDRRAGVYVTKHDDIPMTPPLPPLEADRVDDDGSVFQAGQTTAVTIEVQAFERSNAADVRVRDRIPSSYEVVGGDDVETYPQGTRTAVEFTATVEPDSSKTLRYFVEVPDDAGSGAFGPVEVSPDGREWDAVGGTVDTDGRVGFST
ncbi:hypothetical protein BRC88_13780 [Halobacteriales archaeon QS_4_69_225]|nr:MAG: hypothetical protein BRC88_13780 [Halobacteriales archaeon QS_4_69_225]